MATSSPWVLHQQRWTHLSQSIAAERSMFEAKISDRKQEVVGDMLDSRRDAATVFTPKELQRYIAGQKHIIELPRDYTTQQNMAKAALEKHTKDKAAQDIVAHGLDSARGPLLESYKGGAADMQKFAIARLAETRSSLERSSLASEGAGAVGILAQAEYELADWKPGVLKGEKAFAEHATRVLDAQEKRLQPIMARTATDLAAAEKQNEYAISRPNPTQQKVTAADNIIAANLALTHVRDAWKSEFKDFDSWGQVKDVGIAIEPLVGDDAKIDATIDKMARSAAGVLGDLSVARSETPVAENVQSL